MARILVIDDEPRVANFISRALATEGHLVDRAFAGYSGLRMIDAVSYELVLLDTPLPDADGSTMLRHLATRSVSGRVIVLSEVAHLPVKLVCFALGATDFIVTPFAVPELVARVQARVGPWRAEQVREKATSEMQLDPRARTCTIESRTVELSEREFSVAAFLHERSGNVCGREEILSTVWGYWFDPGSNIVDVIVARLRRKLGHERIETVRGVGFRLIANSAC